MKNNLGPLLCKKKISYLSYLNVYFSGNATVCTAPFIIHHAESISPETDSYPGRTFTVACMSGYYPTEATGSMECNENNVWHNKPSCICELPYLTLHFLTLSYLILSPILSYLLSYLISYLILTYLISSHLISSHLISYHIISPHLISSHLQISSHLISCYRMLSLI